MLVLTDIENSTELAQYLHKFTILRLGCIRVGYRVMAIMKKLKGMRQSVNSEELMQHALENLIVDAKGRRGKNLIRRTRGRTCMSFKAFVTQLSAI